MLPDYNTTRAALRLSDTYTDYNTTRAALRLSESYTASDLCCSCCTKNNLESASKSKNTQEQVNKD